MSRKFALAPCCLFLCLVMFLCICFINIPVSSPTFERGKKENHLNSGDPEEGEQNPEVRSKLALRALPLAAYLVNISTSFLLSKHVNWCRCTLDWPGQAGIEILFVLYFFFSSSLFRTAAHNLSGINDVVNKMQQVCGWICLAGLVPVLLRDKPTAGLIYLPQPHPAALCTGRTTSQLITG